MGLLFLISGLASGLCLANHKTTPKSIAGIWDFYCPIITLGKLKKNGIFVILSFFLVTSSFGISYVEATPTVTIYTDKDTYSFGEYLSITIDVSEVTGDHAVLVIRDEFGKGSTPIEIPITGLKTIMPSPYPFDPIIYVEGKYYVDVEYSGSTGSTEFNLIDSGNIVIPFWCGGIQTRIIRTKWNTNSLFLCKCLIAIRSYYYKRYYSQKYRNSPRQLFIRFLMYQ